MAACATRLDTPMAHASTPVVAVASPIAMAIDSAARGSGGTSSARVADPVVASPAGRGGFAAAARSLDLSPAVVTRLVADLEEHLGTRLLHRSTRRLSLSAAGENYLSRVRVILQDIDEADRAVSSQTHELAGVLRILAPPVLATHVLAPLIAGFRQLHPKIVLNI